jgi:hypothetical protein
MRRAENITALFVTKKSIYKQLLKDCWDIDRDALNWKGGNVCIAHPPCRAWGQLSHLAKPAKGEKELALFAIKMIRKYGGVLEHPRASRLWPKYLPLPGHVDKFGGFSLSISQSWWGHKAQKKTLIYIVGCSLMDVPIMPLNFNAIEYSIGGVNGNKNNPKKELPKKLREETPVKFAEWLIELAHQIINVKNQNKCEKQNGISRKLE